MRIQILLPPPVEVPSAHLARAVHAACHPSPPLTTQPDPEMDRLAAELKDVFPDLVRYWTGTLDEVV